MRNKLYHDTSDSVSGFPSEVLLLSAEESSEKLRSDSLLQLLLLSLATKHVNSDTFAQAESIIVLVTYNLE